MENKPLEARCLELLAPARDLVTGLAAINHGADAVYIGGPSFGARAAAGNSVADIAALARHAHRFKARVYVTLNTLVYEGELASARALVWDLYAAGVDALIVQDMALLEMDLPPIALHASTQCDARTPAKVAMLARAGFGQIVLPREFSLDEIRAAHAAAPTASLEAFVHGALCVSYSGDCRASLLTTGRSANRGECAQLCRLRYTLTDAAGRPAAVEGGAERHWLSLPDMARIDRLADMADAGISSFKIEGRLKDIGYVKNITAAYSRALDAVVGASGGRYRRASAGRVAVNGFEPDITRSFNRGLTPYFLDGVAAGRKPSGMQSWQSPKWTGRPVGRVVAVKGKMIHCRLDEPVHNGDGLGFFGPDGRFAGFRVNRAEGGDIFPASAMCPQPGTVLYRNADKALTDALAAPSTAIRTLRLDMELRRVGNRIFLRAVDELGRRAELGVDSPQQEARSPQRRARARVLLKLGDTIYCPGDVDDTLDDADFVPASVLTALRRDTLALLDRVGEATYRAERRRPSQLGPDELAGLVLVDSDNVANSLARRFYTSHGAAVTQAALEVAPPPKGKDVRVMTTRYCLRRELGCCLLGDGHRRLPGPLYLQAPVGRFRLDFDCANCRMNVVLIGKG